MKFQTAWFLGFF